MKKVSFAITASLGFLALGPLFGCATTEKSDTAQVAPTENSVSIHKTVQITEPDNAVILFEPDQYVLTSDARSKLRDLVEKSSGGQLIEKIQIAVWSDRMLPTDGSTLTYTDRKLADNRATQIKHFLKTQYNMTDVQIFNMAEKSNWLARMFNTDDAELKSQFAKETAAPLSNLEFNVIKDNGFAGRAVVVVTPQK